MRMKNTALLTGPYDWNPELLPLAEFDARLAAARSVLAQREATALLVHGNTVEHGALAYLTGFVPKLGPAFALLSRDGPIRVLASGGPGMMRSSLTERPQRSSGWTASTLYASGLRSPSPAPSLSPRPASSCIERT